MALTIPRNRRLASRLGDAATTFLELGANAITRILPHTEAFEWRISNYEPSRVAWNTPEHRQIDVIIGIRSADGYSVSCKVRRKTVAKGVGAIQRTISLREREICKTIVSHLSDLFGSTEPPSEEVLTGLTHLFDEVIVAGHLKQQHRLALDPQLVLSALRALAEQTYENRALTFGCVIDASRDQQPAIGARFPDDFLSRKRFRALSDAYYTAYLVSGHGAVIEFLDLPGSSEGHRVAPRNYFPEWCRDLALQCHGRRLGVALTRNGDVLVFDEGTLRFSYRFGRWQYWNHTHLVDLLKNSARVQRVPRVIIPQVVTAIYRAALDVSFRRSGGMFIVLRNRANLPLVVRAGDRIDHPRREPLSKQFDEALPAKRIQDLPRTLIIELAALDGAIVLNNHGELLAYGAVLEPRRRGRIDVAEGSRTKAAIGASNYGLVVKVSSDGDITVYARGTELIKV